jgi:KDO2-lipid IV(A) lauroyltransferase
MTDDARQIINSPFSLNVANFIGKHTSVTLGHRIAVSVADFLSARKGWKIVRATRNNQWVASGEHLDDIALDKLVQHNIRNIAISIFDYYHNISNPAASLSTIVPHPVAIDLVQRPEFDKRGLILAGIHMSNFDMAFQIGGLAGVKALVMTLSELNDAYQKQWDLRSKSGLKFVIASVGAMKSAVNYLHKGGLMITAIDRPEQNSSYRPKFFGHPAALPIHHVFLALKAQVPVIVVAVLKQPGGMYHFLFSEPIEMIPHPDRHTEIITNAENILRVAEDFIRHDTAQWSMTFPVWPEVTPRAKAPDGKGG